MATARLRSGEIVQVPDGLNKAQVQQYLLENGASYEQVGLPPPAPKNTGPAGGGGYQNPWAALAEASQPVSRDIGAGVQEYVSERVPGMDTVKAPDTFAAGIGRNAIPFAAGLAVPGAGWTGVASQGLLGAGLEALRKDATTGEVLGAGATWAGGAALGNMASRVATGIREMWKSARGGTYLPTTSETARTLAETLGGRSVVNELNQKALNRSVAASFGQQADALSPEVLRAGADDLAAGFREVVPASTVLDLRGPVALLDDVSGAGLGVKRVLPKDPAAASGTEWQDLRRAIQERITAARGEENVLAQDLEVVLDTLDDAAEASLGPRFRPAFRRVRELWKNLKVAEELGTVKGGQERVTPAGLAQKLAQKYGTTFLRDSGGVLPETQQLFDTARVAARDTVGRVANSGTPTRQAVVGATAGAAGLLTGATTPEAALAALGGLAAAQGAGVASVGREVAGAAATGAQAANAARAELERKRREAQGGAAP